MSKVSDKLFYKMGMNQKRKSSGRIKFLKCIVVVYLTLNVFDGINYFSEGALIQPTLSFTTSASQSGKKQS